MVWVRGTDSGRCGPGVVHLPTNLAAKPSTRISARGRPRDQVPARRELDRLRELGYEIRALKGREGGYRLDAGSTVPPMLFDTEQVVAIAIALQAAVNLGTEIDEPTAQALNTVRQTSPNSTSGGSSRRVCLSWVWADPTSSGCGRCSPSCCAWSSVAQ